MGYTNFSKEKVRNIIDRINPTSVLDLGSQNDFSYPYLPAPYISEWYNSMSIDYTCIDVNNENGSLVIDLTKPIKEDLGQYPLVVDCGVIEHLEIKSKFDWKAIYNGWKNKHELCEVSGYIYSENPKTGSWPSHGFNYMTENFYRELVEFSDYEILDLGEHAACNNTFDGWNIFCTLKKTGNKFPTLAQFKKMSIKTS